MNREIGIFLINGFIAVIVAYIVYMVLISASLDMYLSSLIPYFSAMLYGYIANKKITFKSRDNISFTNVIKYIGLHLFTMIIYVYLNSYFVVMLEEYKFSLLIAFILPISLTATLNFWGLRFWVFKKVSKFQK